MSQTQTPTQPPKAPPPRMPDECGVPDATPLMHPLMRKNFGQWAWHDRPRPGVLHHVAKSGDQLLTVKAGTQRQMDVYTIRDICDIVDKHGEGHVRFTTLPSDRGGRRRSRLIEAEAGYRSAAPAIRCRCLHTRAGYTARTFERGQSADGRTLSRFKHEECPTG